MKTILAGTDFTPSSANACRYAALLAQRLNCRLIIFNLYQTPVYHANTGLVGISFPGLKKDSHHRVEQLIGTLKADFPNLSISGLSSPRDLTSELEDFIARHRVAAVVMGLEAKTKISKFIYGSHGTSISGKIDAPVIIVPDKYRDHRLETLVLAIDNRAKLTSGSIKGVEKIAKSAQLYLKLLHVRTPDEVISPAKSAEIKVGRSSTPLAVQNSVSIETGIKKYCSANETDLVAIMSKKHSAIYNFFNESVTKRIAFASKIPVMAIHE